MPSTKYRNKSSDPIIYFVVRDDRAWMARRWRQFIQILTTEENKKVVRVNVSKCRARFTDGTEVRGITLMQYRQGYAQGIRNAQYV